MSRKKGNRTNLGSISNISPNVLETAYANSVRRTPQFHHPAIVRGTASRDHLHRDYVTWLAGVVACVADPNLKQQIVAGQGQQGFTGDVFSSSGGQQEQGGQAGGPFLFQPTQRTGMSGMNLPNNARMALQSLINKYEGVTGRIAA